MIQKVISGFQTGADIAGIKAAVECGIKVGGYMPKGYFTENGNKPEYKNLYNAIATDSPNYLSRTLKNVLMADTTIIFDYSISSGSKKTKEFCVNFKKHYLYLTKNEINNFDLVVNRIYTFIKDYDIQILNIAGNRESKTPGIEKRVFKILVEVFNKLKS